MGKDCIKENKDKFPEQMSLKIQHTDQERSLMAGLISLKPEYFREVHNSKDQYKASFKLCLDENMQLRKTKYCAIKIIRKFC